MMILTIGSGFNMKSESLRGDVNMFPKDSETRKICSRGEQLVHTLIDTDYWLIRFETNIDVGRDMVLELSEEGEFRNYKIECQIKSTRAPVFISKENIISVTMETSTLNYALNSCIPFVLFLADISDEIVYYLSVQDYFMNKCHLIQKLESDQKYLNIHIDRKMQLNKGDQFLQGLAKKKYNYAKGMVNVIY